MPHKLTQCIGLEHQDLETGHLGTGAAARLENRQTRETGFQDRPGSQKRGEFWLAGRGREDAGQRMGGQPGSGRHGAAATSFFRRPTSLGETGEPTGPCRACGCPEGPDLRHAELEKPDLETGLIIVCRWSVLAVRLVWSGLSWPCGRSRGGYRISLRGGRPVMNWCLNAIEWCIWNGVAPSQWWALGVRPVPAPEVRCWVDGEGAVAAGD